MSVFKTPVETSFFKLSRFSWQSRGQFLNCQDCQDCLNSRVISFWTVKIETLDRDHVETNRDPQAYYITLSRPGMIREFFQWRRRFRFRNLLPRKVGLRSSWPGRGRFRGRLFSPRRGPRCSARGRRWGERPRELLQTG